MSQEKNYKGRFATQLAKTVCFSLIPLFAILLSLEVVARIAYYQRRNGYVFALGQVFDSAETRLKERSARKSVREVKAFIPKDFFNSERYAPYRAKIEAHFKELYEEKFDQLIRLTRDMGTKVLVLYIPSPGKGISTKQQWEGVPVHLDFFRQLSHKYGLDFMDITPVFAAYSPEFVTLLPENGHLSRFGNHLLAEALAGYIRKYNDFRISRSFETRPKLLGDLPWFMNDIINYVPSMPYRVVLNSQGLRMDHDIEFPKKAQHILCIGDSFTFGPYLENHDTYPGILNKMFPEKEVINAGVAGYSIEQEAELFEERAKYCEPDILILQVLDNDIWGFFFEFRQRYDRKKRFHPPSKIEFQIFKQIRLLEKQKSSSRTKD